MEAVSNWPVGSAKLVNSIKEIPVPRKFIGTLRGYYFFKTRHGEYAISYAVLSDAYKNSFSIPDI